MSSFSLLKDLEFDQVLALDGELKLSLYYIHDKYIYGKILVNTNRITQILKSMFIKGSVRLNIFCFIVIGLFFDRKSLIFENGNCSLIQKINLAKLIGQNILYV